MAPSNWDLALYAVGGAAGAYAAAVFLFRKTTTQSTKFSLTVDTDKPPAKVIAVIKDCSSPYSLDATSPLLPLPTTLGLSYLDKTVLHALRIEDAAYGGDGSSCSLIFKALGCDCQLDYTASAADDLVSVESKLTASGPVGPVYVVRGVALPQVLVRMLLLKVKLEAEAKADATAAAS